MSVAPCKYCFIHSSQCHAYCEFYETWREEATKRRESIHAKKYMGNMLRSVKRDSCEKQRRRHKK